MRRVSACLRRQLPMMLAVGTVKLTAFKAMQETQVVGGQWFCAYAAVSVAVISRQICRL